MELEQVKATAGISVAAPGLYRSVEPPAPSNDLGKDEFLQLLVAQLKYQDPLEPTSSEQFIATTAQFTVVEKLDELTKQGQNSALVTSLTTASSLVGRQITASRDGVPVTAAVLQSRITSGQVVLDTDLGPIGLDQIVAVGAVPTPTDPVASAGPVPAESVPSVAAVPPEPAAPALAESVASAGAVAAVPDEVPADDGGGAEPAVAGSESAVGPEAPGNVA